MKKVKLLLTLWGLMVCMVACGGTNKDTSTEAASVGTETASTEEEKHYSLDAKCIWFETLEEMEDYSELIVRVVRLDEEETMITTVDGEMVSGFTFSQVEIKEIYQDTAERYSVGDKVTVLENEVYDENKNVVYHIAGYNMMEVGKEYLLFLHYAEANGSEYYVASGVNEGTISLENDDRQKTYTDELGNATGDFSIYEDIWAEALEKYIP